MDSVKHIATIIDFIMKAFATEFGLDGAALMFAVFDRHGLSICPEAEQLKLAGQVSPLK
jgi:hypothetical protein